MFGFSILYLFLAVRRARCRAIGRDRGAVRVMKGGSTAMNHQVRPQEFQPAEVRSAELRPEQLQPQARDCPDARADAQPTGAQYRDRTRVGFFALLFYAVTIAKLIHFGPSFLNPY